MQRRPEDRVLPYNDQTCLIHIKYYFQYYYQCLISFKILQSKCINPRRHSTSSYYIAIYRFTIKTVMSYWKLGFHHESRLGTISLLIRDTLTNVSGSPTVNPWIFRAGPRLSAVDWLCLNTCFPVPLNLQYDHFRPIKPEVPQSIIHVSKIPASLSTGTTPCQKETCALPMVHIPFLTHTGV